MAKFKVGDHVIVKDVEVNDLPPREMTGVITELADLSEEYLAKHPMMYSVLLDETTVYGKDKDGKDLTHTNAIGCVNEDRIS